MWNRMHYDDQIHIPLLLGACPKWDPVEECLLEELVKPPGSVVSVVTLGMPKSGGWEALRAATTHRESCYVHLEGVVSHSSFIKSWADGLSCHRWLHWQSRGLQHWPAAPAETIPASWGWRHRRNSGGYWNYWIVGFLRMHMALRPFSISLISYKDTLIR